MKTIVIDPGHGGYDYGAVNGSRYEKDDNLRLGLLLRDKLRGKGYNIVMTRDTDVFIPLLERSAISNRNNADIFVSLHRNASTNPNANGVENFVQTNSAPIYSQYARNVLNEVVSIGVQANRGVSQENFSVLRNVKAPGQLLELGFISNTKDNQLFDQNLNAYAEAIARGILKSLEGTYTPLQGSETMRSIQSILNARYNAGLVVDGVFGLNTKKAIIKGVQTELNRLFDANLVVDGVFGAKTKAAIPALKQDTRGDIVFLLQALLYANGYSVKPDGIFGLQTESAVRQFQRNNGLAEDGVAGRETVSRLLT